MTISGFLGRALMDPATGLPNIPYFCLVQEWEQRRAKRRGYAVRVISIGVEGKDEALIRSLGWRLCQELRTSDLIASEGRSRYRVLLTSPDAENAEVIKTRIEELGRTLDRDVPKAELRLTVTLHPLRLPDVEPGPCDPLDESVIEGDLSK